MPVAVPCLRAAHRALPLREALAGLDRLPPPRWQRRVTPARLASRGVGLDWAGPGGTLP